MAPRVGLAMALVAMLWTGATAQMGCMSAIISLSPCLNYVTGSSPTPSSSCCTQLASVVNSQVQCLCTVLNGGSSSLGITINQTRATALPAACNVQTPPASQCNATSGPSADSPTVAPAPSSSSMPGGSSIVSTLGNGSKAEGGQISDTSFMAVPSALIVFLAFITSLASAITFY